MKRSHPSRARPFLCPTMELTLATSALALLLIREVMHFVERRDMLDRLMARSLPEYKDNAQAEDNQLETEPDDGTIPIEQAETELLGGDDGEEN